MIREHRKSKILDLMVWSRHRKLHRWEKSNIDFIWIVLCYFIYWVSRRRRTTMGLEFSLLTVYSLHGRVSMERFLSIKQVSSIHDYFLLTVSSLIFIYVFRLLSPKKKFTNNFVVLFLLLYFFAANPLK